MTPRITPDAVGRYAAAAAYGLVLFIATSGWGWLACRVLRARHRDFAQRAAIGLAAIVVVGGLLEATGTISRIVLFALLGLGTLGALPPVVNALRDSRIRSGSAFETLLALPTGTALLIALTLLLAGIQYAGTVTTGRRPGNVTAGNFNNHDDFHAYIVFPRKMLETGWQNRDPFSERRLISGLGGKPFLDAFVLAAMDEQHLHLFDPGLGTLLLAIGFLAWARNAGVRLGLALTIVLLLMVLPPPIGNLSALTINAALYFALAREGLLNNPPQASEELESEPASVAVPVLLIAGLGSMKSTALVAGALLGAATLAFRHSGFGRRVATALLGGAGAAALLVPWMVSLYRSSGTPLYPLLGRGVRGPAPDPSATPLHALDLFGSDSFNRWAVIAFLAVVVAWFVTDRHCLRARIFAACAVSNIPIAAISLRGFSVWRYTWPVLFPTAMVLLAQIAESGLRYFAARPNRSVLAVWRPAVGAAIAALSLLTFGWTLRHDLVARHLDTLRAIRFGLMGGTLDTPEERASFRKLQTRVPAGAPILARLTKPYLADFRRNPVLINDWPGGASPAPGLPSFRGPDALSAYLTSIGIRYVAFSYRDEAGFPAAQMGERLGPRTHPWNLSQTRYTLDYQQSVRALGDTRQRVADDGTTFILDLCKAPNGVVFASSAQVCSTDPSISRYSENRKSPT